MSYISAISATRKRFFRKTGILQTNDKYEITLDQRRLKTPMGHQFIVDNEALAIAVAAEWDAQKNTIQQSSMHLVRLVINKLNRLKFNNRLLISERAVQYGH